MSYYLAMVTITLSTSVIWIYFAITNKSISEYARKGFIISFSLTIVGMLAEVISTNEVNESIKIFLRTLQFSIIPLIPVIFSKFILKRNRKDTIISKILKTYIIIYEIGIYLYYFTYKINGFYEIVYNAYLITFALTCLYLFVSVYYLCYRYQNTSKDKLIMIMIFIAIGGVIQTFGVKVVWSFISIVISFLYNYYNEIIQSCDGLTNLLNQKRFNKDLQDINEEIAIIVFDVNDFKEVNDTYGHHMGDKVLKMIAQILKDTYQKYGKCYRMGGDEFAVILNKKIDIAETLNKSFVEKIIRKKETMKEIPYISYGMSLYNPCTSMIHSAVETLKEADKEMYEYKSKAKKEK